MFFFFFFFTLWKKQTPKQSVTYSSCADRFLNTIQQDVVMPVREQWHTYDNDFSILPSPYVTHSLTHDNTISDANTHIHTHQLHRVNKSKSGQIWTKDILIHSHWLQKLNSHDLFPLHCLQVVIFTILIKNNTFLKLVRAQQQDKY